MAQGFGGGKAERSEGFGRKMKGEENGPLVSYPSFRDMYISFRGTYRPR